MEDGRNILLLSGLNLLVLRVLCGSLLGLKFYRRRSPQPDDRQRREPDGRADHEDDDLLEENRVEPRQ